MDLAFFPAAAQTSPSALPAGIDYIWAWQGQVAFFEANGKIGLIHKDGTILAEAVYDKVYPYVNGFARVKRDGLWGMIDLKGRETVKPQWTLIGSPSEGMIAIMGSDHRWGYSDTTRRIVVQPVWDITYDFWEGVGMVTMNDLRGFINAKGELVLDVAYRNATGFYEGLFRVTENKQQVYRSIDGREVFRKDGYYGEDFSEGVAVFGGENGCGYIDKTGKFVIAPQYDLAEDFSQGLAAVMRQDGTWCYINHNGDVVLEGPWRDPGNFSDGLAYVLLNGKYGYIDLSGELVLDYQWGEAGTFYNGFAEVRVESNKGDMGYINTDGEYICGIKAQ